MNLAQFFPKTYIVNGYIETIIEEGGKFK